MRPRSWTDEQLREAVASSVRLIDVLRKLDLSIGGASLDAVRKRILQLELDCSHMERPPRSPKWQQDPATIRTAADRRSWTDDDLRTAVAKEHSIRGVLVQLGLKIGGGQYIAIRKACERLGLDTSHFKGKGWSRGQKNMPPTRQRPLEEILVENSDYQNTGTLRTRLLREGLKEHRCESCQLTEWLGMPIPLQLDHINGNRTDHRLENLRLLCPTCHSLTDTWCGRNTGRYG